jgi:hypothetical protein
MECLRNHNLFIYLSTISSAMQILLRFTEYPDPDAHSGSIIMIMTLVAAVQGETFLSLLRPLPRS